MFDDIAQVLVGVSGFAFESADGTLCRADFLVHPDEIFQCIAVFFLERFGLGTVLFHAPYDSADILFAEHGFEDDLADLAVGRVELHED